MREVADFVVEHGEIEGETETNGVCWEELADSNVRCSAVSFIRFIGAVPPLVTGSEFGKVAVVVAHPEKQRR